MAQIEKDYAQYGKTWIDGTAATTGKWFVLQFLADTLFASLTDAGVETPMSGSIASITFKQGAWVFGDFTRITLASGALIAYKRKGDGS